MTVTSLKCRREFIGDLGDWKTMTWPNVYMQILNRYENAEKYLMEDSFPDINSQETRFVGLQGEKYAFSSILRSLTTDFSSRYSYTRNSIC